MAMYPRTDKGFSDAFWRLTRFAAAHPYSSVWLYATAEEYVLSQEFPPIDQIAPGTRARCYRGDLDNPVAYLDPEEY